MSANRLMRLSITIFVAFLAAWALVAFFEADARATQHCIAINSERISNCALRHSRKWLASINARAFIDAYSSVGAPLGRTIRASSFATPSLIKRS